MGEGGVKNLKIRGDIICERPLMVFSSHNKLFLYIFSQNVVHESQEEKIVSGILGKKFKLQYHFYVEIFFCIKAEILYVVCISILYFVCIKVTLQCTKLYNRFCAQKINDSSPKYKKN